MPASWRRSGPAAPSPGNASPAARSPARLRPAWLRLGWPHARWAAYLLVGGVLGALAGQFLVLVLAACGLIELSVRSPGARPPGLASGDGAQPGGGGKPGGRTEPGTARPGLPTAMLPLVMTGSAAGGLLALAWVAFKVGALSYGGGFVIIPLMQHDAVHTYHWMTGTQFLSAVALGQVTPGPVVQTVAVVGFAAAGIGGGLLAALVAFTPSLAFVLVGGPRFAILRQNAGVQAFLSGAGPAAIGAIAGSAVPLALELTHLWQAAVLGLCAAWLLALRRNVVAAIVGAAGLGVVAVLAGAPLG